MTRDHNKDMNHIHYNHLGNIRLSYKTNNGPIEIVKENNYYPFGLEHRGYTNVNTSAVNRAKAFKYNFVEQEEALGLNLYEMEFRQYDAAIARFTGIDPVTHHSMSTYNAFDNNPIFYADPSGADAYETTSGFTFTGPDAQNVFRLLQKSWRTNNPSENENAGENEDDPCSFCWKLFSYAAC